MSEDVDDEASSCGGAKNKYRKRKSAGRPRKKEPGIKKEKGSSASSEDEIDHSARATNLSGKKRASRQTQNHFSDDVLM